MNWLYIAIAGGFAFVLAVLFAPDLFRKKDYKIKPPLNVSWHGRHPPDGMPSNIEWYYTNENGHMVWKFAECPDEIRAELNENVFEETGARSGNGFFIFDRTVQGNVAAWSNPAYGDWFKRKSFESRLGRLERLQTIQKNEIQDRIHASPEMIISENRDAEYTKHKIIKPIRLLRTKGKWRSIDDMEGPIESPSTESP